MYRSGTTLLTRMLNNHPDLWVTYDSVHFMRFSYKQYDPISDPQMYNALLQEIHNRIEKRWAMKFNIVEAVSKLRTLQHISYSDVYNCVMWTIANHYKKAAKGWGEKTALCWSRIPDFLTMFPDGKVIHILRDPRDVLCSFKKLTTAPPPGYLNTAFVALDSFLSCRHYLQTIDPQNYMVLRYEDLVSMSAEKSDELCHFLEIPFSEKMLDVMQFTSKTDSGWWDGDSAFEQKITSINTNPIDRWKEIAFPIEIFCVEMVNRTTMPMFGYELSGIDLSEKDRNELFELLCHESLLDKYHWWLKTGQGIEGFSTDLAESCPSISIEPFGF